MGKIIVKTLVVGQLSTNCYLVIDKTSAKALVIDPGDDADYIIRILTDLDIKPTKIIATHAHFDHILAATELKMAFDIPFLIHRKDEFLLERMQSSSLHFIGVKPDPKPKVDEYLEEKTKIDLGKYTFTVLETPGHTPGSISVYNAKENILFSGDLVFQGGSVGRIDYSYSNISDLKNSIKKILGYPNKTLIYSGHGEITTIGSEANYLKKFVQF